MQYTAIFHRCKNCNFQMKNCDGFLIFAKNIDCGYTLEPPQCMHGLGRSRLAVNTSDSGYRGRGFEPHSGRRVVS